MQRGSLLFGVGTLLLSSCIAACGGDDSASPSAADEISNDALTTSSKLTVFDCKTQTKVDEQIQHIQFAVKNIADKKKLEILTPAGNAEDEAPIKVQPEGRVSALNENLSAGTGSRMLRISGDSDGFYLLELALYKNSDYKSGYLRIYGAEDDGPHQYAKVSCDVTQR